MTQYLKLAMLSGWDFYTGKTINYRENIGKTVTVPSFGKYEKEQMQLCSDAVLHASKKPNDAFIGAKIPCSVYRVLGKPVLKDKQKYGFLKLFVEEEIPQKDLDTLFGWRYSEACNPIHPLKIVPPQITDEHRRLLQKWASVWASVGDSVGASVWDSVRDSVWASVWASVWDSVWASVWASVGDSVGASVWDSVGASVWDSVWASVWAYIGSLFPKIKAWKYIKHKRGTYPFQPAVDLWKIGLVPSFDGEVWRLHGGSNAKILLQVTKEELEKVK